MYHTIVTAELSMKMHILILSKKKFYDSKRSLEDWDIMIKYVKGNIFESPAQVIVNTVNTVGIMGKGIALEYKKKYPEIY